MHGETAVVTGATGLTGSHLIEHLLKGSAFDQVVALTRKPLPLQHPRLINPVVNFADGEALANSFEKATVVFSAIGTTQKKVKGDLAEYRKVDHDIPVNLAKAALRKGAQQVILVSSVGANAQSGNFYLRLKGEVEQAISALGYGSVYILRPSMLLGDRGETRLGESIAKAVSPLLSALLFGGMRRFHSIKAEDVAKAMVKAAKERKPGVHIWHYDEMMEI